MSNGTRQFLYQRPSSGVQINWSHPLSYKLVLCCLLNDIGQRVYDISSRQNHGTLTGFSSPPQRSTLGTIFNGTTNYISLKSFVIESLKIFTIVTWCKTTSATSKKVYSEANSVATNRKISITVNNLASGDASFGYQDSAGTIGSVTKAGLNSNDGKWHCIGGVMRSASLRELYFDGILMGKNTTAMNVISINNANIGVQNSNGVISQYFDGTIGYVLIYHRALSQNEMMQLYINPYCMIN